MSFDKLFDDSDAHLLPSSPAECAAFLRRFNVWRRGEDESIEMPNPKEIGFAIAMAAELIVQRPDFREMREMLRAMQAGELTVSRGIEILDMWHAGNWNDNMLPPVRHDLIEEDSMPVEIIDRLKKQRDELLAALGNLENDDGSIPSHAWSLVQSAIASVKGGAE